MNRAVFLGLLFLITIVHASRVYYVSNFGSNDNNGLSETTAFKSINHANNIANHGDIIKLSVGHYQGDANCVSFHRKNITLVGPAKLQCNKGLRIKGVNFHGVNITVNNVTISHADNITLENVKLSKGLLAYDVNLVNLTSVYLTQGVAINTVGSDLHAVGVSSFGSGVISVRKGGIKCVECDLPLFYLNTTKPTSVILTNSTFVGVSVYKLQTEKNVLHLRNFGTCNITGTNITCEDSGYTGMAFIASNCTVTNSTIENCTTTYNTSGVAVHVDSSNSTFTNVTIQNNSGNSTVYIGSGSNITINNSTIGNNWGNETTNGTAIFVDNDADLQLNHTTIHNNVGFNGAAIFISENARVKIENSLISDNRGYLSGDIACEKKPESLVISDTKLTNNLSVRKSRSNCFD